MTLNVYWAIDEQNNSVLYPGLEYVAPQRVLAEYRRMANPAIGDKTYWQCPAVTGMMGNVFSVSAVASSGITITDAGLPSEDDLKSDAYGLPWIRRFAEPALLDTPTVELVQPPIVLFCEQEVDVTWTSPFFSRPMHMRYGALVPGSLNIGAWFRPLNLEFQLWRGVNQIHVSKGEPLAYIHVLSGERVALRQFVLSDTARAIVHSCVASTTAEPRLPLAERYESFRQSDTRSVVLSEIRMGIVE